MIVISTVPTTCSRPSTKMSAFIFTVTTTCSRPSTKMRDFIFSCVLRSRLSMPDRLTVRAENLVMDLVIV